MVMLNSVRTCIEETHKNMKTLEIDFDDIKGNKSLKFDISLVGD